jgi:osmotically-inducible protein OsmY
VEVVAGEATIHGAFADAAERDALTALVRTVPGVTRVELAAERAEV